MHIFYIMDDLCTIIQLLRAILLQLSENSVALAKSRTNDELLTRTQVKDYLNISEATYKRKVSEGTLKPMRLPGGHRYLKSELESAYQESRNRGRT